jgi:hypothetical protein
MQGRRIYKVEIFIRVNGLEEHCCRVELLNGCSPICDRDWGLKPKGTHRAAGSICDEVEGRPSSVVKEPNSLNLLRKSLHQKRSAVTGEVSGL